MERFEMEEEQLLNLSLSLGSHTKMFGHVHQSKIKHNIININYDLSETSDGSSDGGECTYDIHHQTELFRLLQIRNQMLSHDQPNNNESRVSGVQLNHLLLKSATLIHEERTNGSISAISNLIKLYQNASVLGGSAQRLAAYYTDGLASKLLKQEKSPLFGTLMNEPSQGEEFLAFTNMYKVSPCYQFSHFTANQAILEAFESEQGFNNSQLHVVDFDCSFGLQWPSLLQSLSEKATPGSPVFIRVTGFGSCPDELAETEARLVSFSKGFGNFVFEFQGLVRGSKIVDQSLVRRRNGETLAVNLVLPYLHTSSYKVDYMIEWIRRLHPSIVVLVQREGSCDNRVESGLISRLVESLNYYAAMFGSLEDCLPIDSLERLNIERSHLGRELKREIVMASEYGADELMSWARYEGTERWKERMEGSGFEGLEMSTRTTMQAKLLLRMRSHCHPRFRVVESGKAISIGWQDRVLITATAWKVV